jgi:hypothetical protein
VRDRNRSPSNISTFDFDILRNAFKGLIAEERVSEEHWVQLAKDLIRDLTDHEDADEDLIKRIMGR